MQLHEQPHALNAAWKAAELATDGTHRYLIVRMGLNHRLIGIDERNMPTYGWCFKTYHHAYAALLLWEPDTQDEPLFWHKRAGEPRRAPGRDHNPDYNRPRCVHGSYLHDRVCDIDPFCSEMPRQGSQ
jgi:hypothetical protein